MECVRQPLKGFRGRHRNHFSNFTSSKWWCHWWWKRRTLAFLPLLDNLQIPLPRGYSIPCEMQIFFAHFRWDFPLFPQLFWSKAEDWYRYFSVVHTGASFPATHNSPEVCVSLASCSPRYTFILSHCGFSHFQTGLYG